MMSQWRQKILVFVFKGSGLLFSGHLQVFLSSVLLPNLICGFAFFLRMVCLLTKFMLCGLELVRGSFGDGYGPLISALR